MPGQAPVGRLRRQHHRHADYTYLRKYGDRDPRGGGRNSARLTAPSVAAGAVACKWLLENGGTRFIGWLSALSDLRIPCDSVEHIPKSRFADIAHAMMGIRSVEGLAIGSGFATLSELGSLHGDALTPQGFATNHADGALGGIGTGQDLVVGMAIKTTNSIRPPRPSIERSGAPTTVETHGRHDLCVGIRATSIDEAARTPRSGGRLGHDLRLG